MKKDTTINIRLSELEKKEIECGAIREGMTNSEYLRHAHRALLEKAGICAYCGMKKGELGDGTKKNEVKRVEKISS
jgi:uncharacterized CHY-type Zn-finger protein